MATKQLYNKYCLYEYILGRFCSYSIISIMIRVGLLLLITIWTVSGAPASDKMASVPGYPLSYNTSVYTGYLDLKSTERAAHYVFVESVKGANNSDPLTLWLNGGPGCSSLIGFIQQIGPYFIDEGKNYKDGDNLTQNPHSWHRVSNLLFIESPAGVGYSYNTNTSFRYNDAITAHDNMNALLDFFQKFPEYKKNNFWLAGESYAGKYIPDLAVLIDQYNIMDPPFQIKLKGIMVGNGIMNYETTGRSQIEYMKSRSFTNPETGSYWVNSCQVDPESAGCRFFLMNFREDVDEINPFNVYSYCYYNDSFGEPNKRRHLTQESILMNIKRQFSSQKFNTSRYNGPTCAYFDGMHNYFNVHEVQYKAKFPLQQWNGPCAENISYVVDPSGSMHSYRYLLGRLAEKNYQIHLYNGNWDVVVPFIDTVTNIKKLDLIESYLYTPWFTNNQHSGFQQIYSGILFTIVKGGSHMVPQSKRPEAFDLFNATLSGHSGAYIDNSIKTQPQPL